jgi:hypothetical protein
MAVVSLERRIQQRQSNGASNDAVNLIGSFPDSFSQERAFWPCRTHLFRRRTLIVKVSTASTLARDD